jgi:hypothetical protein
VGTGPDGGEALGNRARMGRGAYRAVGDEAPAAPATTGDGRRGAGEQDACVVASSELRNDKKRNGQRDGTGWRWWCERKKQVQNRGAKPRNDGVCRMRLMGSGTEYTPYSTPQVILHPTNLTHHQTYPAPNQPDPTSRTPHLPTPRPAKQAYEPCRLHRPQSTSFFPSRARGASGAKRRERRVRAGAQWHARSGEGSGWSGARCAGGARARWRLQRKQWRCSGAWAPIYGFGRAPALHPRRAGDAEESLASTRVQRT